MKTIGFVISAKKNEKRRALLPADIAQIRNRGQLYFEQGYGEVMDVPDDAYRAAGANVVTRSEAFEKDVICPVKAPEPDEQKLFRDSQTLFGWVHAVQGREITDFLLARRMTAIAWEDMYANGEYVFWRNREIAGEAAILHSILYLEKLPDECNAALLGRGKCARGAFRALCRLGARVKVYDRVSIANLRNELHEYDLIVNAVLWDVTRDDRIIYREDLVKMKPGSMIVDISCDTELEIETSRPTTISDPVYVVDGIKHYAVDHTPSLFHKSITPAISGALSKYIDPLVEGTADPVLDAATVIDNGVIKDERIRQFQKR